LYTNEEKKEEDYLVIYIFISLLNQYWGFEKSNFLILPLLN